MPSRLESEPAPREPNKLILCFDGTGNEFTGSNGDTNVVKLLNKLDRNHAHQYHYYQSEYLPYHITISTIDTDTYNPQLALAHTRSMRRPSIIRGLEKCERL